jgi:hypothetical protein
MPPALAEQAVLLAWAFFHCCLNAGIGKGILK